MALTLGNKIQTYFGSTYLQDTTEIDSSLSASQGSTLGADAIRYGADLKLAESGIDNLKISDPLITQAASNFAGSSLASAFGLGESIAKSNEAATARALELAAFTAAGETGQAAGVSKTFAWALAAVSVAALLYLSKKKGGSHGS